MKAAYYDPNPCVMLEHKGLYWSKIKGTEGAKTVEPDEDYVLPFGKGRVVISATEDTVEEKAAIITYGMGVYWSQKAAKAFKGQVEIIDLRTLVPLDTELIFKTVSKLGKCLVVTEEPEGNTFAQSIAGMIQKACFRDLDAPVEVIGAVNTPAIPLNSTLESTMIPNADKVEKRLAELLAY
jgi:2-oxoisovalerate dehydrogenase E1 component